MAVVEDVWGAPFERLAGRWSVARRPDAWRDQASLEAVAGTARALVVRNRTPVTRRLLESAPDLVLVARAGAGLDNIDVAAADALGVVVVAAKGVNAISVAEHAVALALAVARRIVPLDRGVREGAWQRTPGRELAGGTWGLLSAGATARATARLAQALGMSVVAYDPYVAADDPELRASGVEITSLEEVARRSDVVSAHLPLTDETRGLVGTEFLAAMKPSAILVNCGRGEVVDEHALAEALAGGHLGGAGLDVRASEPPTPGRLEELDNVVLTPHVAGITEQSQERIAALLCDDIDAVLSGGAAAHAVTGTARPLRRTAVEETST